MKLKVDGEDPVIVYDMDSSEKENNKFNVSLEDPIITKNGAPSCVGQIDKDCEPMCNNELFTLKNNDFTQEWSNIEIEFNNKVTGIK